LVPGFELERVHRQSADFSCRELWHARHSPPPNPPPSRGRAIGSSAKALPSIEGEGYPEEALGRHSKSLCARGLHRLPHKKPSPSMGEGLGGGGAAHLATTTAWMSPAISTINRALQQSTSKRPSRRTDSLHPALDLRLARLRR